MNDSKPTGGPLWPDGRPKDWPGRRNGVEGEKTI